MTIDTSAPAHIAIIMDGNRRWAKEHMLPVAEGHRRVATKVLEPLIEHAADVGVKYLTLWAWSTENWKRAAEEVGGIMSLLRWGFDTYGARMHKKGMRIRVIGDISKLDADIQASLQKLIELTRDNTRITVIFALNYGGRDEIIRAIEESSKEKKELTEESFAAYLDTAGIPDPDLIIRPGGEKRLSGFLLWQSQYSELFFADWYMPEFTPQKLDEILEDFAGRKRRFGA
jgi:undecaprenyl diphosphate synthase